MRVCQHMHMRSIRFNFGNGSTGCTDDHVSGLRIIWHTPCRVYMIVKIFAAAGTVKSILHHLGPRMTSDYAHSLVQALLHADEHVAAHGQGETRTDHT